MKLIHQVSFPHKDVVLWSNI